MMRKKKLKASMGIVCLQVCRHNYLKSCFNLVQIGLQIILISKFTVCNLLGTQRDSVKTISHPDHLPQPLQDILSSFLPLRMLWPLEDSLHLPLHYGGIIPNCILDTHPYTRDKCSSQSSAKELLFAIDRHCYRTYYKTDQKAVNKWLRDAQANGHICIRTPTIVSGALWKKVGKIIKGRGPGYLLWDSIFYM